MKFPQEMIIIFFKQEDPTKIERGLAILVFAGNGHNIWKIGNSKFHFSQIVGLYVENILRRNQQESTLPVKGVVIWSL